MPRRDYLGARRGTAALWASRNSVLDEGEIGAETDTHRFKIGDGVTHWVDLAYVSATFDLENVPVQQLRDTDANLSAISDPFLSGQLVYGQTTGKTVIGDGESLFNDLPDLRKQFQNVVTVCKDGRKGIADFRCSDPQWNSDDECIQAAIDYAASKNIKTICILDGYYIISSQQLTGSTDINLYGIGDVTLYSDSLVTDMISLSGTVIKTVAGSDVAAGSTSITVSDATNINVGDLVIIYDNTIWNPIEPSPFNTLKTGEIHEVLSISDNTLNFIDTLLHSYTQENSLSVQVISPISISINNIKMAGSSATNASGLLSIQYAKNCIVSEVLINNGGVHGIYIFNSYNISIHDSVISNCNNINTGYGIVISSACADINVYDNKINTCRHCVAVGGAYTVGQSRNINIYDNNLFAGVSHAIDAHQCVESIFAVHNTIYANNQFAFCSGAKLSIFRNNDVIYGSGVTTRGYTQNMIFLVENNSYFYCSYAFLDSLTTSDCTIYLLSLSHNHMIGSYYYLAYTRYTKYVSIQNNTIDKSINYYGIYILNVENGIISKNIIINIARTSIYLHSCTNISVNHNKILDGNTSSTTDPQHGSGIAIVNCSNLKLEENDISDTYSRMRYCIYEGGTSDNNKIKNNSVNGAVVSQISKIGTSTSINENIGYRTESTGTATITASSTSVTISHGLVATPTRYSVTPSANVGNCWIDTITSTQMTIHCSTAPEADTAVSWSAQVV